MKCIRSWQGGARLLKGATLVVALAAIAGAGCSSSNAGGDPQTCGPENCTGCCLADGQCLGQQEQAQAGFCGSGGQQCTQAACSPITASACNGCTGSSCCDNGECVPRSLQRTRGLCGAAGASCVSCPADQCQANGQCGSAPVGGGCSDCGSDECCQNGTCLTPAEQEDAKAYGSSGQVCQPCLGVWQDGRCDTESCANCNSGCCYQGECLSPQQQASREVCGSGGFTCEPCSTGQCIDGVCLNTGTGACPNCQNGCCHNGVCLNATQQIQQKVCGAMGNVCQPCTNGTCVNGQCKVCDSFTCSDGCCNAQGECLRHSTRQSQQSREQCGDRGAACRSCFGYENLCFKGRCEEAYRIVVISAALRDRPSGYDDAGLFGGPSAPDPYVQMVFDNGVTKNPETSHVQDSLNPTWSQELAQVPRTDIQYGGGLEFKVYDSDFGPDDFMGSCRLGSVTPTFGYPFTITFCSGDVIRMVVEFRR